IASPGSEENDQVVPSSSVNGRSAPDQLLPPLVEKYVRIGSRKISLDPAASIFGLRVSTLIIVSLCGPGSLLTFTLLRTLTVDCSPLTAAPRACSSLTHRASVCVSPGVVG